MRALLLPVRSVGVHLMTRRTLVRSTVTVAVLTYPIVWALGYQDHPWHYHDAANAVAFVAVVVSTALHILGKLSVPPVARGVTGVSVAVSYAALVSALAWDAIGRPSDLEVMNGGVLVKPIVGTLLAAGVVWAATPPFRRWALRRRHRSDTKPTPIT